MRDWKECLIHRNSNMSKAHFSFVVKASSMVFIPPEWPHAVSMKCHSIGICGSMVTIESLFHMPFFWDEHRRIYPKDGMPAWRNVSLSVVYINVKSKNPKTTWLH